MSAPISHVSLIDLSLLESLPDGMAYFRAIRTAANELVDFELIQQNSLFVRLMPASYQLIPFKPIGNQQPPRTHWQLILTHFNHVLHTGQLVDYVLSVPIPAPSVTLRIGPYGDGVIVTVRSVAEPVSQTQLHWFDEVLNASLSNTIVYEAIRDRNQQIQDFRITFANKNAEQDALARWGKPLTGNTLLGVNPNSRSSGQFQHCVQVVESGQPLHIELHYPEIQAWYETSIARMEDGCIVTGLDITARKYNELHIQLQHSDQDRIMQELRQSNENLRQFAQVASHDLQEPLRKIQTFSDILQNQFEDNLSDGERDMARRIQKSAERMRLLIKDLLTYSQLATQREPPAPVSLSRVLEEVSSDLELAISDKQATIDADDLPTILGSSSRLRQLFQNLIANALKFQQANQLPLIQIRVRLAEPGEVPTTLPGSAHYWLITVRDNGLGFDEKYKDRIFHPFQRLHDAAYFSGTGIGLAICQRVVDSHGGAIDVSSVPGSGSVFKLFLPVYTAIS